MEIVVTSDTHRSRSFIEKLTSLYPNSDLYLHAGDSELEEVELVPFRTVRGNCDWNITRRFLKINIKGVGIYVFHGDHFYLDDDLLVNLAKENDCNIIIYGHTHIPYYNYKNGVHILNPGSIMYPRVTKPTYALIHFTSIDDIKIEIKDY